MLTIFKVVGVSRNNSMPNSLRMIIGIYIGRKIYIYIIFYNIKYLILEKAILN